MEHIKNIFKHIGPFFSTNLRKLYHIIDKRPLQSFFAALGALLFFIIAGNILRTPAAKQETIIRKVKEVEVYSIGKAPRIRMQAKIEKSGAVKIMSLSGGVVQNIYKHEGDSVSKGTWLFWLSSNYQGGTASTVSRQIAEKNYNFIKDTYDTQKEIIAKNKETAQKLESQAADLRDISAKSVDETKSLISLNENVVSMLDEQIKALEAINVNGSSNSAILQLKQGKSSAQAGLNQAKAGLRSTEYQTNSDNEPAVLSRLQKETTLKQLEIQEKSLDLNKEISLLNLRLAQIQESLMYPASPVEGVVERVYVKVGQNVPAGTLLATLTGNANSASALVFASRQIALGISNLEQSTISGNGKSITVYPSYTSTEPTEGTLHTVLFRIPDEYANGFSNDQIVTVDMPIGLPETNSVIPFIPLDSIYQTDTESYIYVASGGEHPKALSRKVELGMVTGEYVEVKRGLGAGDQVIIDRNIVEGDDLKVMHYGR